MGNSLSEQWAVRRYLSEFEGPLKITGRVSHTSDWVRVTATGIAGSGLLYVYLTGTGEGYLDDMKLVVGEDADVGANLIVNGDFENPVLAPAWTVSPNLAGSSVTTAASHTGSRGLRIVSSGGGSSQGSSIWQTVAGVTAGQTYTLSYWYLPTTNSSPLIVRFSGSWIETTPDYCGDGAVARILVDGTEVFQQRALVSSTDYSVTVPTHLGSRVDFVIDPGSVGDAVCDGIGFTAAIQTSDPTVGLVADSAADWSISGSQGEKNWFYGYFNAGTNTGPSAYHATNFTTFPRGSGPQSANNFWDGEKWEWFNGRPPFDRIEQFWMTPNGTNNGGSHWVIKRWVSEVSGSIAIDWSALKEFPDQNNSGGGGVTMRVFQNGVQRDVSTIAGGNVVGVRRTVNLTGVAVGDSIDIAVDPANAADGRPHDDTDRTFVTMSIRGTTSLTSQIASDVRSAMQGVNATAYLRIPFNVDDPAAFNSLKLRMKYDDGFVAYLNGDEVARDNAPLLLDWASFALTSRQDSDANGFAEFDISEGLESLRPGENVLAIHGLNRAANDGDFLILPELIASASTLLPEAARYFMLPTPGEVNGVGNTNLGPLITVASHTPNIPKDDEALLVTANVSSTFNAVGNVRLIYRVVYSNEVNTPMFDDGQHGDGVAGDGLWGASIPASASNPGQMLRYYVFAADSLGNGSRFPTYLDPQNSPEYQGTVVFNPTLTNGLPVMQFFVQNQVAATNYTGTRGSIFWDEEFFDNVKVSGHGQTTWSVFPKRSMDFNLNTGFKLRWKRGEERVKAFDLLTTAADKAYMRMTLAFEAYRDAGVPTHFAFPVRLQQNNAFHSIMTFTEQANDDLLQRNGLDPEGALYKIYFPLTNAYSGTKKATRKTEPNDDLQALIDGLRQPGAARRNYFFDHVDVAEVVNWMATIEFVQNEDCCFKNYYVYRDTRGNGEWQMLPWDHDLTFGRVFVNWATCGTNRCGGYYDTNIYATNLYSTEARANFNFISAGGVTPMVDAVLAFADTQEMFYRRWSSVQEELLQPQNTHPLKLRMERRVDELSAQMAGDSALDFAKWLPLMPLAFSTNETFAVGVSRLKNLYLKPRRNWIFNQLGYTSGGPYLGEQPTNAVIRIASVEFNPAGDQAREYIQFTNANTFPVDVSRWQLTGAVTHIFKPGTVMPARSSLYLSPDVKAFRARTSGPRGGQGLFVQGNYKGQLSAWGESLGLVDTTGRLVSGTNYSGAPSLAQRYLRITEIMYHPPASPPGMVTNVDEFEYIELRNISTDTTLDLVGVRFTRGIEFSFADGGPVTSLPPGASTVIVRSIPAFTSRYGSGPSIAGQWIGQLDNQGETLRLEDANGEKILEFDYEPDWYPITDGVGFSLVSVDVAAPWETWSLKSNWRPSLQERGAPGQIDPVLGTIAAIRVNEVLTHTDLPAVDSVELFNPSGNPVNLRGWFLSDDFGTPRKFRISTDVILAAGGYHVFDESAFNSFPGLPTSFAFSSLGDEVFLFSGDANTNLTGYFHGFRFGAAENGVPFGRYVTSQGEEHFVAQTAFTPNAVNAGPRVGPVVVSEILFHPPELPDGEDNGLDEFVELQNVTTTTVPLFDPLRPANTWRLAEAVGFIFPANVSIPAGGRVVVVGFDPADALALAGFRARFGVSTGIPIFGPYEGKLDNSSDRIELYKPGAPETGVVPYVLVDAVEYRDSAPWPKAADGTGASLLRLNPSQYGNDPINWIAALPTPGSTATGGAAPSILLQPASQNGVASQSAILHVMASGSAPVRYQWRFNGANLQTATNATLTLNELQPEQAGQYSVAVYNPAGAVISSNASLRVLYAAYMTSPPLSVNLRGSTNSSNYGFTTNNATFNVAAIGSGVLRYQWRRNGEDLPGTTATSLTVSNVDISNEGDYQVAITDDVGTIVSTPVRINVLVTPMIVVPPVTLSVITGATFTVGVIITGNPAPFGYEWRQQSATRASNVVSSRSVFATFSAPTALVTNQVWRVVVRNMASTNPTVNTPFFITTLADTDSDGVPDKWETDFGMDPGSGLDRDMDGDGDGMLNWQEYVAGTDPTDVSSYLKIDSLLLAGGANVLFGAVSNRTYSVEYTDDLKVLVWSKLADFPARNFNRTESVVDPGFTTNRNYRLVTPRQP